MRPTPHLDALPYTRRIMAALGSVIGRSRLMRVPGEGDLYEHVDVAYYWRDRLRVHVPVVSDPAVQFHCGAEVVHMAPGEVWVFDTWRRHKVVNPARTDRTHLVIDTVGSAALWDLIRSPDREPRRVAADGPEPTIVTERVNKPAVASPWEVSAAWQALLDELAQTAPAAVPRLARAFEPVLQDWRNAWARFGDGPDGAAVFARLRQTAEAAIVAAGGAASLPNGVRFVEAARNHVLVAPALVSDDGDPAAPGADATAASPRTPSRSSGTRPADRPRIERPVFIVSPPRSGSSLLFETLARSPDLFTIGGESHQVIEAIPGLRPAAHGWDSNRLDARDATAEHTEALRAGFLARLHDRDGRPPTGPVRMLEKTPKNALRVPFLAEVFPDAVFVYLYRDPRETVSSMLDAWRSGRFVMYPDLPGWPGPSWSLLLVPGWRDLVGAPLAQVVTTQWATTTTILLDDLDALPPDRWCVTSYDRIVADPQSEMERLCDFAGVRWDVALADALPLSRHTLDSPHPDKWRRNAAELEPYWEQAAEVAARAHAVFANPPRIRPVAPSTSARPSATALAHAAVARPVGSEGPVADAVAGRQPAGDRGADLRAHEREPDADAPPEMVFGSRHTATFPALLERLRSSVLVSTYQSGHVIVARVAQGRLNTHFRAFPSPMGIAAHGPFLALGTRAQIHVFQNQPAVVARLEPPERHDACYMPRRSHTTGDVRVHDLAYAGDELWVVNTRFSCLATLDDRHSFVPRWRPPFVTALAPEDRCHLNGLCVVDGAPRFVTALAVSDEPGGWRDHKLDGGVVVEIDSGEVVSHGLCMPHSPRWHDDRLWVLESGRGLLVTVDPETGSRTEVASVPGFARGLSFLGPYAFVGLSQVREHVFDGLPLTREGVERTCGVWVVDLRSGATVAWLRFEGRVREIYEVVVLPGIRFPEVVEPGAEITDGAFVLPDEALTDVPAGLRS